MVCWSLSAIIGCDTIQQPLVQVKPESMVSLVNINRTLYIHVIKKLGDIDSGKPIIKFVLKLTHSCPCSEKGHRHLQITALALIHLVCTRMNIGDFESTSLRDGWKVMRRVNPNMNSSLLSKLHSEFSLLIIWSFPTLPCQFLVIQTFRRHNQCLHLQCVIALYLIICNNCTSLMCYCFVSTNLQ